MRNEYEYYKNAFEGCEMPYAFVDLDLFDENIASIQQRAAGKSIRIATKSVRCRALLERILKSSQAYQGLMCFTAKEAVWLAEMGFDDLLIAYPTVHPEQIKLVLQQLKKGKSIYLMTDKTEHLQCINAVAKSMDVQALICLDIDLSTSLPGLHFGVHRSAVNSLSTAKQFFEQLSHFPNIKLSGIMGYEAQIAGLGNNFKGQQLKNIVVRFLQKRSMKQIVERRTKIVELAIQMFGVLDFVNGGGTGSVEQTVQEALVSEVTVGSGFYTPTLFDNYKDFQHLPSAAYAIEIVRKPQAHIYTCLGGGYVASGGLGPDKLPSIYLPLGAALTKNEMAGEVQTPVVYKGSQNLSLGDPIFMRHAKAGELCERFNELLLLQKGDILGKAATYRGEGQCFL